MLGRSEGYMLEDVEHRQSKYSTHLVEFDRRVRAHRGTPRISGYGTSEGRHSVMRANDNI